ncbi:MAG: ribbon-helix-helix protein, CopG family [Candidatus Adiutrix sp.]|jgi:predicted transcriptional regulator|nr:ribbon-helix-helix protein, CopG family [Candidatus Adiutrix sp.]
MTVAAKPISVKLDISARARLDDLAAARRRSVHWLMREAVEQYIAREEKREEIKRAAVRAWEEYRAAGLRLSFEETDRWLADLEEGRDTEPPACRV